MGPVIGFIAFIVIAGGIVAVLNTRTRNRMRDIVAAENEPTIIKPTKRQQQVLAEAAPVTPRPTIEDLVAEEAAATGVNDIPGGDGLDVSLKLRVFWRDEVVRRGCDDGHLEFRVDDDVDPDAVDTDDVRLVCVRGEQSEG